MSQTLKVPTSSLKRVKVALEKHGITSQKALAEAMEISLYKVREFMAGRPIEAGIFMQICERLELDWQKITRISTTKAEEIMGNEPTIVPSSAPVPPPTTKRTSIPRLASHLFRGQSTDPDLASEPIVTPQAVVDPIPVKVENVLEPIVTFPSVADPVPVKVDLVPEPIVTPPSVADHVPVKVDLVPEPIVTPPSVADPIPVKVDLVSEPIVTPQAVADPIPVKVDLVPEPIVTPPSVVNPVPTKVNVVSEPIVTIQTVVDPIPAKVDVVSEPIVTTQAVADPVETELIIKPNEVISVDEMIVTEEGNLPVLETVVPHTEPAVNWDVLLTATQTLIDNEQWDEAAHMLQQFEPNPPHLYRQLLELSEQLLPPHWKQGGRRISDPILHGWILSLAGILSHNLELLPKALPYLETALKLTRQYPDRGLEIQCFKGLAHLHQSLGNYQAAISFYQQYFDLAQIEDLYQEQAPILFQLGNIYYALHQYRTAIGYYNHFLNHDAREQFPIETLKALRHIGTCYINLKHYQEAITHLEKLAALAPEDPGQQAFTCVQIGVAYAGMGLHHTALEYLEQSRSIATPLDQPTLELQALKGLTLSYVAQHNYSQADRWGREWLTLARLLSNRDEQVRAMYYLRQLNRSVA